MLLASRPVSEKKKPKVNFFLDGQEAELPQGGSLRDNVDTSVTFNGHKLMAIRVVAAAVVLLTGCTAIPVADRKSQAPVCNPHVIAEVGLSSAAPYPANQPTAK